MPGETILHGSSDYLCCQCSRNSNDDGSRITWVCQCCGKKVCRHCTQTFTNDLGIEEYYHATLCSPECQDKHGDPPTCPHGVPTHTTCAFCEGA